MALRILSLVVALAISSSAVAAGRPITPSDLVAMARISDPQLSPDGSRVLYTVAVPDMTANRTTRDVWMVSIGTGETRNLTRNGHEGGARWSPDGKTVAFISTRRARMHEVSGSSPTRLTTNPGFDGAPAYSPDGSWIAYHSQARAGYESAKWRLMVLDRKSGQTRSLAEAFDRSVEIGRASCRERVYVLV